VSPGSLVTCALGWMVDHMEFGDAVGVVAALLSLVALYFAAKSANASVKAAGAADRSAEASEQSVAVARAARDRAERPQLTITAGEVHEDVCPVTVTMIDGPMMIRVSAFYNGEMFFAVSDGARDGHFIGGQGDGSYELVKNDSFVLRMTSCRGAWSVDANVILLCEEVGEEGREWHHAERVRWDYKPPPPSPIWA